MQEPSGGYAGKRSDKLCRVPQAASLRAVWENATGSLIARQTIDLSAARFDISGVPRILWFANSEVNIQSKHGITHTRSDPIFVERRPRRWTSNGGETLRTSSA